MVIAMIYNLDDIFETILKNNWMGSLTQFLKNSFVPEIQKIQILNDLMNNLNVH